MLLTQFDPARRAIINPEGHIKDVESIPETLVSIFSHELFNAILNCLDHKILGYTHSVDGDFPIYEVIYKGKHLAMYKARLGAPACVGSFEEVLGLGVKRVILLGNCGVLNREIGDLGIIIPTKAIRDEGTSYHYAPAADFIDVNKKYIPEFKAVCDEFGYHYTEGITWTTDAFFRETLAKTEARKAMGAICVEMECAAMQAMCDWRGVAIFQFL